MSHFPVSVSFRYLDPTQKDPGPTREFLNQKIAVPAGSHLPRTGEAIELLHWDLNRDLKTGVYSVLFVHTRIALFDSNEVPSGWHTTVTVGPLPEQFDLRLLAPST